MLNVIPVWCSPALGKICRPQKSVLLFVNAILLWKNMITEGRKIPCRFQPAVLILFKMRRIQLDDHLLKGCCRVNDALHVYKMENMQTIALEC